MMAAKLFLTPLCIAGGFQGGLFAPALFVGAMLGAAYGSGVNLLLPSMLIDPSSFAMLGMAALLAGAIHAPLTAILLIFELTNDYTVMPPLMLAVTASFFVSRRLERNSIYLYDLAIRGIHIERGRDIEVLEGLEVSQVMEREFETLHETDSLADAAEAFMRLRTHGLPVVNATGRLAGILTMQDLDRGQLEGRHSVGEACSRELLVAYPDETLAEALRKMGVRDIGRLPVVDREDPGRLVGLLRRSDLIRAYDAALTLRARTRHHIQQMRLGAMSGATVEELTIERGSPCAGHRISEIAWPSECIIASIRRGRDLLIPHGDTVLMEGDVLAVVTGEREAVAIRSLCPKNEKGKEQAHS